MIGWDIYFFKLLEKVEEKRVIEVSKSRFGNLKNLILEGA